MDYSVEIKNGALTLSEQAMQILADAREAKAKLDRINIQLETMQEAIKAVMESNGIESYEDDIVKITYKKPYIRKGIDSAKLKEQGLYEAFLKETPVKSSVSIKFKE